MTWLDHVDWRAVFIMLSLADARRAISYRMERD